MIDPTKVKAFWDGRAQKAGCVSFESIANLEEDPANLALKTRLETEKVFAFLGSVDGKTVLDLGAGVGQWAFRFVERGAARVTAVEYSGALAGIGRTEAARRGVENLEFVVCPAERYEATAPFDVVFISGLFVYMNDEQAEELAARLPGFCRRETRLLLRDGTGIAGRHEIDDRMSVHLKSNYSATYRTVAQYTEMFARRGFRLLRDENMFDEACPLNRYPETRLRIYEFALGDEVM